MASSMSMNDICDDVLHLIFKKYLDFRSQVTAQRVCKRFYHLIDGIFRGRPALYLAEDSKQLYEICDEDIKRYTFIESIEKLCRLRDGLWVRGQRGLRLLQPLDIQMLALNKHKGLRELCVVVTIKWTSSLNSLMDLILKNCSSDLEKLVVINLNGNHFSLNTRQMEELCRQYPNLKHLEIFSDYLYASEQCFKILMSRCKSLEVLKLNVRQIFSEELGTSRSITYNSYAFDGYCLEAMSDRLQTIYGSQPIINESFIVNRLPQMCDRFANVRHLGVESLSLTSVHIICNIFKNIESLSFSMRFSIENNKSEVKSLMDSISHLANLTKLSIRWFSRYQTNVVPLDFNSIEALKRCSKLSHLVIKEAIIGKESLRAINRLLPNLISLRLVDCDLEMSSIGPLISFTQLKEFFIIKISPHIYIKFTIDSMTEKTIADIIDNGLDLRLINSPNPTVQMAADDDDDQLPVIVEPIHVIPDQHWVFGDAGQLDAVQWDFGNANLNFDLDHYLQFE